MKRSYALLPLVALLSIFPAALSSGEQVPSNTFPELQLVSLSGKQVALPTDITGRVGVLVVAFTRQAGAETGPWVDRLEQEFLSNPRVSIFSVAILAGVPPFFRSVLEGIIKRATPPSARPRYLITFTDESAWKRVVGFSDPSAAYLVVIDARGEVTMRRSGALSGEGLGRVAKEVKRLARAATG